METVLISLSNHNKRLEGLIAKHQNHANHLSALKSSFESTLQDTKSLSNPALQESFSLSESLSRLEVLKSDYIRIREEGEMRVISEGLRVQSEKIKVESEAESRRQILASEYLSALKSLK